MGRGSLTRASASSAPQSSSSTPAFATFDDEENFIISVLISLHEEILGNTASSGPAVDAKNKIWNLISDRLCNKIGGVYRTDEQVKARWRSMRSAYSFKMEKARHIAELFYKKIQDTTHGVRISDITVVSVKFPQWLNNLIKNDSLMKSKLQESPPPLLQKQTFSTSRRSILKRPSPTDEEKEVVAEAPEPKRTRPIRTCVPKLISQFPPSELSAVRGSRNVKKECEKSSTPESYSPTSAVAAEELNSVTESGDGSRPSSVFWEETDYERRRRREEELHQAKLALLRSQTEEADAKTKLTKLQIQALIRDVITLTPPPSSDTVSDEIQEESPPFEITSVETPPNLEIDNQTETEA